MRDLCKCGKISIGQELDLADDALDAELCFDCWNRQNQKFLSENKVEPIDVLPSYGPVMSFVLGSITFIRIAAGISVIWTPYVVCFCVCIEFYFLLHVPPVLKKMDMGLAGDIARANLFRIALLLLSLKDYKAGIVYVIIELAIVAIAMGYHYFYSPLGPRKP